MKSIDAREEFKQMLALDKCLIFVAAKWPQSSKMAEAKVKAYETVSNSRVFEMDIDNKSFADWLSEQSRHVNYTVYLSGAGSLLFVERGTATDHVLPNSLSLDELRHRIQRFFKQ